jgi:hypothetical protein
MSQTIRKQTVKTNRAPHCAIRPVNRPRLYRPTAIVNVFVSTHCCVSKGKSQAQRPSSCELDVLLTRDHTCSLELDLQQLCPAWHYSIVTQHVRMVHASRVHAYTEAPRLANCPVSCC